MTKPEETTSSSNPVEPVVMYTCYGCGVEDGYRNSDTKIMRDRVVGSYINFTCKHCKKENNVT